jgi:hypothetical protein
MPRWLLSVVVAVGCGAPASTGVQDAPVDAAASPPDAPASPRDDASAAHGFLHARGPDIVDGLGRVVMLRGFGLGEWLNIESYFIQFPGNDVGSATAPVWSHSAIRNRLGELMGVANADEFYRRWTANIITEDDVAQYAGWGVNSIRVSINYHWLSSAPGVYLDDGFRRLDDLVHWASKYGVYIIPVMHAAPGGQGNELMADVADGNPRLFTEPDTYQPWTIDLWKTIAARYANEEWVGGYDLFDEPLPPSGSNSDVLPLYRSITAAIREVDPNHMIIVEGVAWAQDYSGLEMPWDDNLAYSFHKYWDTNNLASLSPFLDLRMQANRPVWNGETGENSNQWDHDMVALCEGNQIGWSMWTTKKLNQDTNPYTIRTPANYSRLLDAIGGSSISQQDATAIMFELADNAATSRCTKNTAFITALGLCASCPPAQPR